MDLPRKEMQGKMKKKKCHWERRLIGKEDEIRREGKLPKLPGMGATISGPSKVSASGEISMQMKCKYQKKKKEKGKEDTYP